MMSADANHRVSREKAAYDEGDVWAENDRLHRRFHHVFECPDTLFGEHYYERMVALGAETGTVLDYGCYDGEQTEKLLMLKPQKVIGIDISENAIYEAQKKFGSRAEFRVMDAHRMSFPDNRFDLIVGKAILHHLDYEPAVHEIRRVLRHGGMAVFIEPLRDNPGARLLRFLTPRARTIDEMPLSRLQIEWADRVFGASEHHFFNLVSVPVAMFTSFFFKSGDNALTRLAYRLDRFLARTPLRYWMRSVVLVWKKSR